jgi:hypothetical protein
LIHEARSEWVRSASERFGFAFVFGRYAERSMISSAARGFRSAICFDSSCFKVSQALDVVAERHHCHTRVGSRLRDRTNQFATHLSDRRKCMLDPSLRLSDSVIKSLLTFGELALEGILSPNLGSISTSLQIRLPRFAGITMFGVNVRTDVGLIERGFKMLTVMNSGGISLDFANRLVARVGIQRELEAKVTPALLFRSSGIRILVWAFGRLPVCGHSTFINQCPRVAADMLLWSRNQRRVNNLTAAGQIPRTKQLGIQTIKKGFRSLRANTFLEAPLSTRIRTLVSVGRGGQPPLAQTIRGATRSTSLAMRQSQLRD